MFVTEIGRKAAWPRAGKTEEVIDLCVNYMSLKSIGVPVSHHEGRLQGNGMIGARSFRTNDPISFTQAHFAVLQQSVVVDPYVKEHQRCYAL